MTFPATTERLLTEDEFLALPEDPEGRKRELLDGRVICLSHAGLDHGRAARAIMLALAFFAHPRHLAEVFMDVGFKLRSDPDRVVCPDVGVADRSVVASQDKSRTIQAAPLLAVEVVSPNDKEREVAGKVAEYLAAGSRRVWVVRPSSQNRHRPRS